MTFESGQIGVPELYVHCLKVDNNCPGQQPCEIDQEGMNEMEDLDKEEKEARRLEMKRLEYLEEKISEREEEGGSW